MSVLSGYVDAGLVEAPDAAIADRLVDLSAETSDHARLALALAVSWVRAGSTCLDLAEAAAQASELGLDVPEPRAWLAELAASTIVTGPTPVLRIDHELVYLSRYHTLEVALCDDLCERRTTGTRPPGSSDVPRGADLLQDDLARLFDLADANSADQVRAVRTAVEHRTVVITGGPGTGKTTTVARLLAVLRSQALALAGPPLRVALTAPTGRAAARMREAIADSTTGSTGFSEDERAWLTGLGSSTLHRLLGWRAGNQTRFRHDRYHRLPHDVVIVDETSMTSLLLMARLVEALRPEARLVLVGDADQLASVEAGAVLRDLVDGWADTAASPVAQLTHSHRFGGAIRDLAAAVRNGDSQTALRLLTSDADSPVQLIDPADLEAQVRSTVLPDALDLVVAAGAGDALAAQRVLRRRRVLCGRRSGPEGAATWNARIERWLRDLGAIDPGPWYPGRPLLVTRNDPQLGLFNGDGGVVLDHDGAPEVAFELVSGVSPSRLPEVTSAYAMTIHRSQGSQFDEVIVVLPDEDSRLMTRELLYTAVTRARAKVTVAATEESVAAAINRRVRRSSGIARRLREASAES